MLNFHQKGVHFEHNVRLFGILPSVSFVLLPKVLAYFVQHHPNLHIRLMEGDYDQIEEWLHNGIIDIGFLVKPHSKNLVFDSIFDDELVCIMAKDHPLAKEDKLHLEQLKDERWIMPKRTIDRDVSRILSENKIHPNIVYELSVDQVILTMVNENLGISIVPNSILIHAPNTLIRKKFMSRMLDTSELHTNTVFSFLQAL
ncbi:hypothetical protein GCM10009865_54600 [Aeromicrobium ponti]|uniref:LysR substrate binding domain-containing protein n=1 Tax=Cytobacillus oceanisediminis TaxID=665099 RepID=A0A562J3B0_9BACI|nr:LysR family transcriptional regulator substrate-binding protein [Cytobacillus oceanisediminis]TWH77696.1 LysR substrate binding domain-containing protein [Cytobacillus oceanisediminis]